MSSRGCPQITRVTQFGKGGTCREKVLGRFWKGTIDGEIFRRNYVGLLMTWDRSNFIFGFEFWDMVDTEAILN
jgi:hypothetical protein